MPPSTLIVRVGLTLLLAATPPVVGQTWVRTTGSADPESASAAHARGPGALVVGQRFSVSDGEDWLVLSTGACGDAAVPERIGGPGDDVTAGTVVDDDDGFAVFGDTDSFGTNVDLWLVEWDADGTVHSQVRFDGGGDEFARDLGRLSGGDRVLVGEVDGLGAGGVDGWLARVDRQGQVVWQRALGGTGFESLAAIAVAADDTLLAVGETSSFGAGFADLWAVKLDASGTVIWQRALGGPGDDVARSVALAPDGSALIVGLTDSFSAGLFDAWLVRLDASGDVLWQKSYGGTDEDRASAVASTGGGFVVAGATRSYAADTDAWLLEVDSSGAIVWQTQFGGAGLDEFVTAIVAPSGDVVASGATRSFGAGADDLFSVRVDRSGQVRSGCVANSVTNAVGIDSSGALVTTNATSTVTALTAHPTAAMVSPAGVTEDVTCEPTPGEVSGPESETPARFVDDVTFSWESGAMNCSTSFNLYGDDIAVVASSGSCVQSGLVSNTATIPQQPPSGQADFYLVTGVRAAAEGPLGFTSAGDARSPAAPCP